MTISYHLLGWWPTKSKAFFVCLCFLFFIIPSLSTRMLVTVGLTKPKKKIGGAKFKICGPMDYEWAYSPV